MKITSLAILFSHVLCAATSSFAAEPNDEFGDATILAPGVLSVTDDLEGGLYPDTYLGAFSEGTFPLPPIAVDDDSSPLGDGLADALFDIDVNPDGSIHLAVTGFFDEFFDGSHGEEGDYELIVDVFDSGGGFLDSFSEFPTLFPGTVDEFSFADPTWIGGTFDVVIDNTLSGPGFDPLDFWVFTGLEPGATFNAETSFPGGSFDTELGWFDEFGDLLVEDDDGGEDLFSLITGEVPANGEVILAVSGYPDDFFDGFHGESGPYTLTLTVVPEPSSLLLIALASMLLPAWWSRNRTRLMR